MHKINLDHGVVRDKRLHKCFSQTVFGEIGVLLASHFCFEGIVKYRAHNRDEIARDYHQTFQTSRCNAFRYIISTCGILSLN